MAVVPPWWSKLVLPPPPPFEPLSGVTAPLLQGDSEPPQQPTPPIADLQPAARSAESPLAPPAGSTPLPTAGSAARLLPPTGLDKHDKKWYKNCLRAAEYVSAHGMPPSLHYIQVNGRKWNIGKWTRKECQMGKKMAPWKYELLSSITNWSWECRRKNRKIE
jgi:hypothetical protein